MKSIFILASAFLPFIGLAFTVSAADVPQSGTNTISGRVRFVNTDADILARLGPPGDEGMTSFAIFANADAFQSSKIINTDDRLNSPYALTVTANNTPLAYKVYAYLALDGILEEYWTATQVAAPVTSNSAPATLDFDDCVALIELRYRNSAGQPVATLGGRATVTETGSPFNLRARYSTQPADRTNNFLVVPSGVEFELVVEVDTGTDIYLDRVTHRETRVMMLNCEDKPVITITVPDAGTLGTIIGNANLVGEIELPTDGYQELLGRPVIKARGPSGNQRYDALTAETPGADVSRAFELKNLVPSVSTQAWRAHAEMQFGAGHRFQYFQTPALGEGLNAGIEVTGGQTTDLADTFVMNPARLVGKITLTGPPESGGNISALRGLVRAADYDPEEDGIPNGVGPGGTHGSYLNASGVDELAPGATFTTAGGGAAASFVGAFNPVTSAFEGDYELVLGMLDDQPGIWSQESFSYVLYHLGTNGGPYVNQIGNIAEQMPWKGTLAPGGRATNDLRYGFAEVCVRIKAPIRFYNPRVTGSGELTGVDSEGHARNYRVSVNSAYGLPDIAGNATNEAVVTIYVPEGNYALTPSITTIDADGGQSETQLRSIDVVVAAGERLCVEECIRVFIEPPVCTTNFGFLARANAVSCDGTLTNLSLRASPVSDPSIRIGYSDIRTLNGSNNLTTANGLFPEFDGFPRSHYENILYTATAVDITGRVATKQIIAHYDFTPPSINCPADIATNATSAAGVSVEYSVTAADDRPGPVILVCDPPSGSVFPIGTTVVTCRANDLCHNTNTCTFQITVTASASVETRCFDFDNGQSPQDSRLFGNARITPTGGVGGSGVLKLTTNGPSQLGSFIVEDFSGGSNVTSMAARFKLRIGGATPCHADGVSFVWASDLANAAFGEEIVPTMTGLIVSFDTFDNGGGEAPALDVFYEGQRIAHTNVPLSFLLTDSFAPTFVPVLVAVNSDGTLDLRFRNQVVFSGLPLPAFSGMAGGRFGWGGRTGACYDDHFVDDICLTIFGGCPEPIIECPADITVTSTNGNSVAVEFTVTAPEASQVVCDPPSGSLFPVGTNAVICRASNLCGNTNTCTFQVIVLETNEACALRIELTQLAPPRVTLTWDCGGALQCASAVDGPWTNVVNATSPHTVAAEAPQRFYRLCLSGGCSVTPSPTPAIYAPSRTNLGNANR